MVDCLRVLLGALALVAALLCSDARRLHKCVGVARYEVTFHMHWTRATFGPTVPSDAHVSPLTAAAHGPRFSPFAPFGYATRPVEEVAESGDNSLLVQALRMNTMVGNVSALSTPGSNVGPVSVVLHVDADRGFTDVSAILMLAPTPDWVAFFNNVRVCFAGWWLPLRKGLLYGWDAGTEETPGVDQMPRQNIYRLQAPRYPAYSRYPVGNYTIRQLCVGEGCS